MTKNPDCYKCQYRGDIPGDANSSCHHPAIEDAQKDPRLQLFAILGLSIPSVNAGIIVIGRQTGIDHGWFNHPFNFDPAWLESCTGFKEKT